jgi:hypothetical protein
LTYLRDERALDALAAQRRAESGEAWAFDDPRRVALEGLARVGGVTPRYGELKETSRRQGRVVYEWRQKSEQFMVVVSRPYLLTFFARDRNRIAWVPIAAYELTCK